MRNTFLNLVGVRPGVCLRCPVGGRDDRARGRKLWLEKFIAPSSASLVVLRQIALVDEFYIYRLPSDPLAKSSPVDESLDSRDMIDSRPNLGITEFFSVPWLKFTRASSLFRMTKAGWSPRNREKCRVESWLELRRGAVHHTGDAYEFVIRGRMLSARIIYQVRLHLFDHSLQPGHKCDL